MSDPGSRREKTVGLLMVNLSTLIWPLNSVTARWMGDEIGPFTLTALRFSVALVFFILISRRSPSGNPPFREDGWLLLVMSLTGFVFSGPMVYFGVRYSTAVNCNLVMSVAPLLTALLAVVLIGEKTSRRMITGALMGMVGVGWLLVGGPGHDSGPLFNPGDLLFLGGAALFALYSVVGRKVMARRSPASVTALACLIAIPMLYVMAGFELQHHPINLKPESYIGLAIICLGPTTVANWSWNQAVKSLGAGGAMVFINTLPLYGALMGAVLLGEKLGLEHLIGGGLIVLGGVWGSLSRPERAIRPPWRRNRAAL